jgi:hypothetical protein
MLDAQLRTRVEAAVLEALERVGPDMLDRGAVMQPFHDQGVSVRTLYRWAADYIDSGRAGQALAGRIAEASAARAARVSDPAVDAAREVVETLPKLVTVETITGTGPVSVMLHLQEAIQAAQQVMRYAKTPEGAVRNAKLLLSASTSLRQCLDTALRIFEAMHSISEIEKFHSAIFDALRAESPELAERVVQRLQHLTAQWGVGA